jgi:hypothetical protein
MRDLIEERLMWIPSHVGLVGNELVDGEARYASLNGSIFDRPLSSCGFLSLARPEEVGFGGHWPICSLHSAKSITTSMVQGSERGEELCYLCI